MTANTRVFFSGLTGLICVFLLCACTKRREVDSSHSFSVMTYNLDGYGLFDRDGDGQPNNPKPEHETGLIHAGIVSFSPDILAIQEIGNPLIFEEFRSALKEKGLEYPYYEFLGREGSERNMALLSRYPIVAKHSSMSDRYGIGEASLGLQRGIIDADIEVAPNLIVKVIVLHLKSKQYHSLGQTEMRRNEARIVAQRIRRELNRNPELKLIVMGTLNDQSTSAPIREIVGAHDMMLLDMQPADSFGDSWTRFSEDMECYQRVDYILSCAALYDRSVKEKIFIVNQPDLRHASCHRPLMATFKSK